ncbi:MAG: ABC transporter substrate-binding protein [Pseudomonadota bacterium]
MRTTRRTFMKTGAAAAAVVGAPGILRAQSAPSSAGTLRAVMHGDLASFDPIWTTANITSYHGGLIYDTLFSLDETFQPRPQMVGDYTLSDDQKTWTFKLRDGLAFSTGEPVTARDCVASIRRWAARDGAAQHMFRRVTDTPVVDDTTFQIVLSEPYGLVLDALAKVSTNVCYIMREKEAMTDPNEQVSEYIGSGPFIFNRDETTQGARYVYDKNQAYVPRDEPVSGVAGGKRAYLERVILENISDPQTAMAALQAGEIDFYETPPTDLIDVLMDDPNIVVKVLNTFGNMGWIRLNFLHPPFDNEKMRQGMLHLIKQSDIVQATFGNPEYYKECAALLGCGTPMENDVNTAWFSEGQNIEKARQLFQEAGYDGTPVTVLQATNIGYMNNAALLIAQWLREAGVNVNLEASDWGGVVTRRAVKSPPDDGGWNIFVTWASGHAFGNPIGLSGHSASGGDGWFGWPENAKHEELRDAWAAAPTFEERFEIGKQMQENAWNFVPHVYGGQWVQPAAYRSNLEGVIAFPELVPFWNMDKV